jgi:hypothetical protein
VSVLFLHRAQGTTNLERAEQALVNAHHGASIVELSAVVRRAEQSDKLALREELVPILDYLVGSANQVHVVLLEEARHHVGPEREGNTAIIFGPPGDVLIRVGPEEVAEQTTVGNLK